MHTGFLNIDKPPGMTSHDVVDAVRRVADQRQVGHTGTLDPFATGVLVLALGRATKLAQMITGADKSYRGEITLGRATDTYDVEGQTTQEGPIDHLDAEGIEAAMSRQRGAIEQIPPPFSAKKVKGKRLYQYARRGEKVEVEPKPVTVHEFILEGWDPPVARVWAAVSPGTYVRTMAHDLGQALGCGAFLSALMRTAVGGFHLEDAVALKDLTEHPENLTETLTPVADALPDLPRVTVAPEGVRRLINGSPTAVVSRGLPPETLSASLVLALDEDGKVLALAEPLPASVGTMRIQPKIQLTG